MRLWRLSGRQHGRSFDGGYGLLFDGRWNVTGQAVTYCATSPALCVLEKLVHVEDPALLPELVMVRYEAPDDLGVTEIGLDQLPVDWREDEVATQGRGTAWHREGRTPLLRVPSAIVPLAGSPDLNLVVNHTHPDAARIVTLSVEPFRLDLRLFRARPAP